jgi:hypothetical protein
MCIRNVEVSTGILYGRSRSGRRLEEEIAVAIEAFKLVKE